MNIMITKLPEMHVDVTFQRHKDTLFSNNLCYKRSPLPAKPPGLEGQLVGLSLTPPSPYQPEISLAALCSCSGPRSQKGQSLKEALPVPGRRTHKLTSLSPPPACRVALALAPPLWLCQVLQLAARHTA